LGGVLLFAFLGAAALGIDKDAWNVPPHQQLLAFFVHFAIPYPICQNSFTCITRFLSWRSPFVSNESLDF
jgi:hypothetical protein